MTGIITNKIRSLSDIAINSVIPCSKKLKTTKLLCIVRNLRKGGTRKCIEKLHTFIKKSRFSSTMKRKCTIE